jgi:hypothetical protein
MQICLRTKTNSSFVNKLYSRLSYSCYFIAHSRVFSCSSRQRVVHQRSWWHSGQFKPTWSSSGSRRQHWQHNPCHSCQSEQLTWSSCRQQPATALISSTVALRSVRTYLKFQMQSRTETLAFAILITSTIALCQLNPEKLLLLLKSTCHPVLTRLLIMFRFLEALCRAALTPSGSEKYCMPWL